MRFVGTSGNLGISVLVLGDFERSARRITTDADDCIIDPGEEIESLVVEPALLPPDVIAEAASVLRSATGDLSLTPKSPVATASTLARRMPPLHREAYEEVSEPTRVDGREAEREPGKPERETAIVPSRRILCLGQMRVELAGQIVEGGWRQKALQLLALLVVNPEGLAKDKVLEALWPFKDPEKSRASLR